MSKSRKSNGGRLSGTEPDDVNLKSQIPRMLSKPDSIEQKATTAVGIIARADDPKPHLASIRNAKHRLSQRIFLWEKYAHAGQLADISQEEISVASPVEKIQLSAMLCEAGWIGMAVELFRRALKEESAVLSRCRYLSLTATASEYSPDLLQEYIAEARAGAAYRVGMGSFSRLVREASSLAVVGNSPAALGRGEGGAVDQADVVVRFNNYSLSPEFRNDYGAKTTAWFRPPRYDWLWRRYGDEPSISVYSRPIYFRSANAHDVVMDDYAFGRVADEPPLRIFTDLRRRLGAPPSSGILALYWIWTIKGSLRDVFTVGFSMTDQRDGEANHYFGQSYTQPSSPHDWRAERELYDALVANELPLTAADKPVLRPAQKHS